MQNFPEIGIQVPEILLPNPEIDLTKWSVIACDQYTSEPHYWEEVNNRVGEAPSTYHLILPEVSLNTNNESERIISTQQKMIEYQNESIFKEVHGIVLVERTTVGGTRHGLMIAVDLEKYNFNRGSQSLIRATEGTIIERLPPRIRIRSGASLELPHIIVLIDDPEKKVIEPLIHLKEELPKLYDFDLMMSSGHLSGYEINSHEIEKRIVDAFSQLAAPKIFQKKYGVDSSKGVLLFAVGDGNHSLATAKTIWEQLKVTTGMDHPARYALVEIENIHDDGLKFEPIHRLILNLHQDVKSSLMDFFGSKISLQKMPENSDLMECISHSNPYLHLIGMITEQGRFCIKIDNPNVNLPVGSIQSFLDYLNKNGGFEKIDYVHGEGVIYDKGKHKNNVGFLLPSMKKSELFPTVILDGALPRKTFSMGEANEKRFYLECRRITK